MAAEPDSCTNARPVKVRFDRSVFSVWRKNANRTSDSGLLLWVCLFVFTERIFSSLSLDIYTHIHWWSDYQIIEKIEVENDKNNMDIYLNILCYLKT